MTRTLFLALALLANTARAQETEWRPPFITTPDEVVASMLRLAGTGPNDLVADLGSGDGRIVIAAARDFGAQGLGIELDARLVELSRANARKAGVAARVSFIQGDVLAADFSQASVVTVYLLPGLLGQLQARFVYVLKPGTRIVSHSFGMAGWQPDRSESIAVRQPHPGQGDESRLHLWVVPADVRGIWEGEGWRLRIEQSYQQIDVEGASRASLSGTQISWISKGVEFRGRVADDRMIGDLGGQPLVLTRRR
ncbi:MAG TPA: class I SAM-dependent methyltransferase [Burkholderiales bacterium]